MDNNKSIIEGKTSLGIEFGSTRIKAVLIGDDFSPLASGSHDWENQLENGIWTYSMDDAIKGLQDCYSNLVKDVKDKYGINLDKIGSIGISAMMHGYLPFDKSGELLVPFRTWRNTITEKAAKELSALFNFNIPQRWSIAHLYQAMLNKEPHLSKIDFFTSLAGYIHWKLTGEKVLGMDDASGIMPLENGQYNPGMIGKFNEHTQSSGYSWKLENLLPKLIKAGSNAGNLSEEGARLLDPSGILQAGIPFCPPEGDAGTGMVATNSIKERRGNVSAGTSIFAMIVLEKELSKVYPEIDIVTTPTGKPVAMVHCNNCLGDLDAWVKMFAEVIQISGGHVNKGAFYDVLYEEALQGRPDCGGLLSYNYLSGEHISGFEEGRPLFVRTHESSFNIANFMRSLIYSSMASLKIGMEILTINEKVRLDGLLGHGGLFKTKKVGQQLMAGALEVPVTVMETAGEGGAWGIALLASYLLKGEGLSLEDFLEKKVFQGSEGQTMPPYPENVRGFKEYMKRYIAGLEIERCAVENIKV